MTDVGNGVTQRAFIVTPTYFLINSVFIDFGFEGKMTAIEEVEDGDGEYEIDLRALERELEKYSHGLEDPGEKEINVIDDPIRGKRKLYRFVIYLVPTYSNPGGLTYSINTRMKLIELARRYDMLIISDDVYDFLNYSSSTTPSTPIAKFNHLDQDSLPTHNTYGNTISNATFSKIVAPGLRVGWQESPTRKLVSQLAITGANRSGGTPAQLSTFIIADLIARGEIDGIIEQLCRVYKQRVGVLRESIEKYLPKLTIVHGGDGGYFLWVKLPQVDNHDVIVKQLEESHGVVLAGGGNFEVVGDEKGWGKHCVRLSISYLSDSEIEEGIKIWGDVIRQNYPDLY